MREMVEQGYIYIATPPLYLVKKGQKREYAWDDNQRDLIAQKWEGLLIFNVTKVLEK